VSDYRLDDWGSIPGRSKEFSFSLCVQTSYEAHPASYPTGTGGPSPEVKRGWGVTLTTHHHLLPRTRRAGAVSPLHLSTCMACSRVIFTLHILLLMPLLSDLNQQGGTMPVSSIVASEFEGTVSWDQIPVTSLLFGFLQPQCYFYTAHKNIFTNILYFPKI
jgi:hypothetical protein